MTMFYPIVLGFHGIAMCVAMLTLVASELLLIASRRGKASPARVALQLGRAAGVLITGGVVAGIALFVMGGWPLTRWLVASVLLIALVIFTERRFISGWQSHVAALLKDSKGGPDVAALARNRAALVARWTKIGLLALIILLMTAKPLLLFH
jgi:hypothetical protein